MKSAEQDISDHQLITTLHINLGSQIILHVWINALGRLFWTLSFVSKSYFKLFYTRGVMWGTLKSGRNEVRINWDPNHSTELHDLFVQTTYSCLSNSALNRRYSQHNWNSMEHIAAWEAKSLLCSEEIPRILWSPKAHYRITEFISARHLSLSWARLNHFMPTHPISWRSILILSSHLRLWVPFGLFPSGLSTKTQYATLLSPIRATCPAHLILFVYIARLSQHSYCLS